MRGKGLYIIDINLAFVTELEGAISVFFTKRVRLVDFRVFGQFPIRFHWRRKMSRPLMYKRMSRRTIPCLISRVFDDNIRLIVLEISK